ncbi:hypothetical protein [Desertibacillus haloalkaliphilus]|uniref:hypothetical protein n=1 Tax=Desertibacillus haloalkaliphilus TaxID=1328930 RepID=UPI001C26D8D6|nr:hypothetical protein [Desertibacillus haloalkaliphilus]MBU8908151.1 hypothetical protein [Desertibacillus haloalkaliphilus]
MKKIILVLWVATSLLTGCFGSSDDSQEQSNSVNNYVTSFQEIIDESNQLLSQYRENLDKLYTNEVSENQFASIVKNMVPKSREIGTGLDDQLYTVDNSLYDFHRDVIRLVNDQHQLFLKTLEEANEESEMNRDTLYDDYHKIKEIQTELVEQLKALTLGGAE